VPARESRPPRLLLGASLAVAYAAWDFKGRAGHRVLDLLDTVIPWLRASR